MVKRNSTSRLSSLKEKVILTQTDTTVGFLSQNEHKLQHIKERPTSKPFIKVYPDFHSFTLHNRVPSKKKKFVRRALKTTFIVKNQAFRIAPYPLHVKLLTQTTWFFSTSANKKGKHFQREFCEKHADIVIENKQGLFEGSSSKLYKINNIKIKRLR